MDSLSRDYTKALLISANVGSIFEDPEKTLKIWLKEFLATVKRLDPDFLAVHCQEVGGKNYEESMQHVNSFIKLLLASDEMQQFDKARIFLDEDFTAVDKFTALGNLYFVHESVSNVQIYDFEECKYVALHGREVLSGNIESVSIKEKAKFPQQFFPDFKWSRKGFIRTRWRLNNTVFDLVNIHLFHDASNILALEKTPSVYRDFRRRAFEHTLERFKSDKHGVVPHFMFGDFNFRLDLHLLAKKLTESATLHKIKNSKNDTSKVEFTSKEDGRPILTVEKKGFDHHNEHHAVFSNNNNTWLHEYDQESRHFDEQLHEYDITFPPSYPFSEDVSDGTSYMRTRCPSWCDRVLLSHSARSIIHQEESCQPDYGMIGSNVCMGDHKPIYLNLRMKHGAQTLSGNVSSDVDAVGNVPSDPNTPAAPLSPHALPTSSFHEEHTHQKQPVKKVISINGEEVDSTDIDAINIHDFAEFENEQHITSDFFTNIKRRSTDRSTSPRESGASGGSGNDKKRRSGGSSGVRRQTSFKEVARNVITLEMVLSAFRHYAHRSDTEASDDDDDDVERSRGNGRHTHSTDATPPGASTAGDCAVTTPPAGGDSERQSLLSDTSAQRTSTQTKQTTQTKHPARIKQHQQQEQETNLLSSDDHSASRTALLDSSDVVLHAAISDESDVVYKPTTQTVQQVNKPTNNSIANTTRCPSCSII